MKRILIPILALLLGIAVAVGMFYHGRGAGGEAADPQAIAQPPAPDTTAPSDTQAQASPAPDATASPAPPSPDTPPAPTDAPSEAASTPPAEPLAQHTGLRIVPGDYDAWLELGSDTSGNGDGNGYRLKIVFNGFGAGIQRLTFAEYSQLKSDDSPPYAIIDLPLDKAPRWTPYAADRLWINGQDLDLHSAKWQADPAQATETGAAITFRAPIVDADDQPVAEVVRTYRISKPTPEAPDRGYDIRVDQKILNRTAAPIRVTLKQNAQTNLLRDASSYLPDRYFATGYFDPDYAGKTQIFADDSHRKFASVIKAKQPDVWPNPKLSEGDQLVWLAAENRYFAVVTHPRVPLDLTDTQQTPVFTDTFPEVGMSVHPSGAPTPNETAAVITLQSPALTIEPGGSADLSFGIYAGPRKRQILREAPFQALGLGGLIRYNIGGMCAFCTFQWLAHGLLGLLTFFHNYIAFDWGVAIILLVVCVRVLLHPITKRAQINMMKMSKQMGALQPEMEKIKKKYKDDQQKLNAEMMKLYREKGVNPAGFLGCAPMMLQTPIWIALYAMLYFAIELRHEQAFYGIFQMISGGAWHFLEDLSVADGFIRFVAPGESAMKVPLFFITLEFRSLNLLPILMGLVFFINQKFTTPPPANEQQAQQQKIMKFMVLLFPVFLYSAPSGLTLYITTSTLFGILDSYLVRKHIKEQEEAGTLFDKKPRKPGGFMDRMAKVMEQKQLQVQEKQRQMQKQRQQGAAPRKRKR